MATLTVLRGSKLGSGEGNVCPWMFGCVLVETFVICSHGNL